MKINCVSCGHTVNLDDAYGDFEGQIKCFACGSLLEIKTEQGNIKSVKFVKFVPRSSDKEILGLSTY